MERDIEGGTRTKRDRVRVILTIMREREREVKERGGV